MKCNTHAQVLICIYSEMKRKIAPSRPKVVNVQVLNKIVEKNIINIYFLKPKHSDPYCSYLLLSLQ